VSSLGKFDSPLVPCEQIDSESFLELANLTAERRLGNVQALGRFAEVQVFRHRDEIPDVTQFHGEAFYIRYAVSAISFLRVPSRPVRALIPKMYQRATKDVLDSFPLSHHALPSCCTHRRQFLRGNRNTWDP
jgi:hypothetical protein